MKRIICILLLFLILAPYGYADLTVHFLDVGQGDAILIQCDNEAMLIDGGPNSASQYVYSYLQQHVDSLDCIVATHPDADHIGGVAAALNAVPVEVIFSPVEEWDTAVFEDVVKYAELQGTPIIIPYEGDVFALGGADITILHCWPEAWSSNDMSICLRLDYGYTSFVFTGDAESMSEYMMIDSGMQLHADVLKVGHHGSASSSTPEFIDAVNPTYAVISCGIDNSYGHPHPSTLEVLSGINVLRTDELGTIVMQSNGQTITVTSQSTQSEQSQSEVEMNTNISVSSDAVYIGNRNSMKFHYPDCASVEKMSPKNRVPLSSREEAIELGYQPCGQCQP